MPNEFYKLGLNLALKTAGLGSMALHGGVGAGLGAVGGLLLEHGLNPAHPKPARGMAIGGLAGLGVGLGVGGWRGAAKTNATASQLQREAARSTKQLHAEAEAVRAAKEAGKVRKANLAANQLQREAANSARQRETEKMIQESLKNMRLGEEAARSAKLLRSQGKHTEAEAVEAAWQAHKASMKPIIL